MAQQASFKQRFAVVEGKGMNLAVVGCLHGELDRIYQSLQHVEKIEGIKIDMLICCGDFQSLRNTHDMDCLACPVKYRRIGCFHKYYSGESVAPVLTLFVGGNHEASNYLLELYHGGWVAPNIFYLGAAGVVTFAGLRIAGLSGIFKPRDFHLGRCEHVPFDRDSTRSVYHVRAFEVKQLAMLRDALDIVVSHDWPRGIYHHGDTRDLLRRKKFFAQDVQRNTLGAAPLEELLHTLQPRFWFAAHLHVKFAALMDHGERKTKFLALDKPGPGKHFMQVLHFPKATAERQLRWDRAWLGIVQKTLPLMPRGMRAPLRSNPAWDPPSAEEVEKVCQQFGSLDVVPSTFTISAPPHRPNAPLRGFPAFYPNPQTLDFLKRLELDVPLPGAPPAVAPAPVAAPVQNPDEIMLSEED